MGTNAFLDTVAANFVLFCFPFKIQNVVSVWLRPHSLESDGEARKGIKDTREAWMEVVACGLGGWGQGWATAQYKWLLLPL